VTYSILGWDATNGDLGVAVQSKFPGVGSLVPYGEAEVGAVATQAFANPRHGSVGLMLLKCGATPDRRSTSCSTTTRIDELVRCYALHRLAYFPSEPSQLVPIGPELALELEGLMAIRGFPGEPTDGTWDAAARKRWELFLGSENYDNRINAGRMLDLEVLADLRRRYGPQEG
jgi:hypothetical protein